MELVACSVSAELAEFGVTVNVLGSGWHDASEAAALIAFLANPDARCISGQTIRAPGWPAAGPA
jgi:hypothetical protein